MTNTNGIMVLDLTQDRQSPHQPSAESSKGDGKAVAGTGTQEAVGGAQSSRTGTGIPLMFQGQSDNAAEHAFSRSSTSSWMSNRQSAGTSAGAAFDSAWDEVMVQDFHAKQVAAYARHAHSAVTQASLAQDAAVIFEYAQALVSRPCPQCQAPMFYDLDSLVRKTATRLKSEQFMTGSLVCQFCNTAMCAGCGQVPGPTSMGQQDIYFQEYMVGWHCDRGRDYILWTALCMLGRAQAAKVNNANQSPRKRARRQTHDKTLVNGIGYGRDHYRSGKDQTFTLQSSKQEDAELGPVLAVLVKVLPAYQNAPSLQNATFLGIMHAMLRRSALFPRLAELLHNDSIDDIAQRSTIYHGLISVLEIISSNGYISSLVYTNRASYHAEYDIMTMSSRMLSPDDSFGSPEGRSLAKLLSALIPQMSNFLARAQKDVYLIQQDAELQDAIQICDRMVSLHDFIAANDDTDKQTAIKGKGRSKQEQPSFEEELEHWFRDNCVSEVADQVLLDSHYFKKAAQQIENPPKGRMRKLMMELTSLRTSLPPGIFVKHAESRIDVLKFIIVGPAGTPYENGLFEFDVFCPENYPNDPPQVQFKTTGGGRAHFNPNLYPCGKVCLSLLGTWSGEPWRPNQSTLLQVFVSIQSMILCDQPWVNEPGREHTRGSVQSMIYNIKMRDLTIRYALLPWAEMLSQDANTELWHEIVKKHLETNIDRILYTTTRWLEDSRKRPSALDARMPDFNQGGIPPPFGMMPPPNVVDYSWAWSGLEPPPPPSDLPGTSPYIFAPTASASSPQLIGSAIPSTKPAGPKSKSKSASKNAQSGPQESIWPAWLGHTKAGSVAGAKSHSLFSNHLGSIVKKAKNWKSPVPQLPPIAALVAGSSSFVDMPTIAGDLVSPTGAAESTMADQGTIDPKHLTKSSASIPSKHDSATNEGEASNGPVEMTVTVASDVKNKSNLPKVEELLITDVPFAPGTASKEVQEKLKHLKSEKWDLKAFKPRFSSGAIAHLLSLSYHQLSELMFQNGFAPTPAAFHHVPAELAPVPGATDVSSDESEMDEPLDLALDMQLEGSSLLNTEQAATKLRSLLEKLPTGRLSNMELEAGYSAHEAPDWEALTRLKKAKHSKAGPMITDPWFLAHLNATSIAPQVGKGQSSKGAPVPKK